MLLVKNPLALCPGMVSGTQRRFHGVAMGPLVLSPKQRAAEKTEMGETLAGQGSQLPCGELQLVFAFSKEMRRNFAL